MGLSADGATPGDRAAPVESGIPSFEFHVSKAAREEYGLSGAAFSTNGSLVFADYAQARAIALAISQRAKARGLPDKALSAGQLTAMALIEEILRLVCDAFRRDVAPKAFRVALDEAGEAVGPAGARASLESYASGFPPAAVYAGIENPSSWLDGLRDGIGKAELALEELLLLRIENENPAMARHRYLFDDRPLKTTAPIDPVLDAAEDALKRLGPVGPDGEDLPSMLRAPMRASPDSLAGQLDYARRRWGALLGPRLSRLLGGLDLLDEEERPRFPPGPGPSSAPTYSWLDSEYERFSMDSDWMPRVVMMAKSTLVWLDQLSKAYGREIRTLDAIPDRELDVLASRGFNALWLIGVWERSQASRRIKELCGNPEAAPSAYSLFDYEIAAELGGWKALDDLRGRAWSRGIRLAADMVPNHTGIDSAWVRGRPDLFLVRDDPPFPSYGFNGENLSGDPAVGLWLEDHYYDRRDAAVVFKRVDFRSGRTSYLYHGNDGTSTPWNDTAQIDFLNPAAREAVKERILHVARSFPIIRFDAAMVLAKRSIRRLWYPEPGSGGAIASRFESAMGAEAFDWAMPEEFWREVVDMCAAEAPDTLLLAEAFWMMEGFFVRTLGMHRVYNSAFMNMLKERRNAEYRRTIKNTIEFDKDILKRFVNFMNNPDEDPAIAQFGSGDQYFGVCSMMATMPGLPMFGHGQVEGFSEKYGMEYRRAYRDEVPDPAFVGRHEREIFPLLKRRYLFSGVDEFLLYDLVRADGSVDENVFAYSNGHGDKRVLVAYNNGWERTAGTVFRSCRYAEKRPDGGKELVARSIADGLALRGGQGRFALFLEARSGLSYIRRSDDVRGSGLALALEGFECQAFIDVREVDDDERGSYARLHAALGGAGTPNLADALEDYRREDLYRAWAEAFGRDFWALAVGRAQARKPKLSQGSERPARAAKAAIGSAVGLGAAEGVLGEDREPAIRAFAAAAAQALRRAEAPGAGTAGTAVSGLRNDERNVLAYLAGGSAPAFSVPDAPEALAALISMMPLARIAGLENYGPEASTAAMALGLPRKAAEALSAAGLDRPRADRAARFAAAALGRLHRLAGAARLAGALAGKDPGPALAELASMIEADEEARALLRVNDWDGHTWVEAEGLALAAALAAGAAAALGAAGDDAASKALDRLLKAASEAGWSLDRLRSGSGLQEAVGSGGAPRPEAPADPGLAAGRARRGKPIS